MNFCNKVDRLLDEAGKACQVQTLKLIMNIRKLRTKKFYNIGPWEELHKYIFNKWQRKNNSVFYIIIARPIHQSTCPSVL